MASTESIDHLDSYRDNFEYIGAVTSLSEETGSEDANGGVRQSLSSLDIRRRIEMYREDRELRNLIDDIFNGDFNE